MASVTQKTCGMCRGITSRPMFIVSKTNGQLSGINDLSADAGLDNKLLIAALLKCTCHNDMRADYGTNAADLSELQPAIRQAIYKQLKANHSCIPVIDPETANSTGKLTFITYLNKSRIRSWTAMDLLSLRQFYELANQNVISLEEIETRLTVAS
jgi:hypothetical protein